MHALRSVVQNTIKNNYESARVAADRGELARLIEGGYFHVASYNFHEGEKICVHRRGSRHVTKGVNDYIYQVEDLRTGTLSKVNATRRKFYCDAFLNTSVLLLDVLQSET